MSQAGFLYFISVNSANEIPDEIYNDYPHLKDNIGVIRNVIGSPEDSQGIIFAHKNFTGDVSYKPSYQNWVKSGLLWICAVGNPTERDLRKKWQGFNFSHVKLSDGDDYRIIVSKSFNDVNALPQSVSLDGYGELEKGEVIDYAKPYSIISNKYSEKITVNEEYILVMGTGDNNALTDSEIKEMFIDCSFVLSGLYNIGRYETSYLKLLTIENMQRVLGALCDYLRLQEAMKSEVYKQFIEDNYREDINIARRYDDLSEIL